MESINPANFELIKEYAPLSEADIQAQVKAAHKAFGEWKQKSFATRAQLMEKVADILKQNKKDYAALITAEMGKVTKEAIAEIEKSALVCEFYAKHAEAYLVDQQVQTESSKSFVSFQPLGIVLAVMPWNFPFWQVFRFAAPALMAGNVGLLKHASNVQGSALAIESVFNEAGFPDDIFKTLVIESKQVASVIEHPLVRAVTLTGSTEAGKKVAAKAGECLKKTVLELGGSDAYIILEDADIEKAATLSVQSRLANAGQSCIAAKRFVVVEPVYQQFVEAFRRKMEAAVIGDPLNDNTDIGPQANQHLRDALHKQVVESISKGATCILGGEIPSVKGAYYPPTILIDVKPGMPAYDEELFGPVASIIKVTDEDEAVAIANDTSFGLGGGVYTEDIERGIDIARNKIESGSAFVNKFVKSDPRLPFGGIKESGYGRELADFGIREFVNIKTMVVG